MKQFFFLLTAAGALAGIITAAEIPEIPLEEYLALRSVEDNRGNVLPRLDHWGVRGWEWDAEPAEPAPVAGPRDQMLGLVATQEFRTDPRSKKLTGLRFHFAAGVTNRAARLAAFQTLKGRLVETYHAPTKATKEDEIVRGQDAYVQGLDKEYRLEWHGPETVVCLCLSDATLFLEFRQAPNSRAAEMRARVQRAREKETLIQQKLKQLSRDGVAGSEQRGGPSFTR